MSAVVLVRQLLLFLHLLMFALALMVVLRADLAIFRGRLVQAELPREARIVALSLLGLWLTGLALIGLDSGFHPDVLASQPKLLCKLTVVSLLSLNGLGLHWLALPVLQAGAGRHRGALWPCAALGAISTVSWLYASFVGSARLIAPWMDYPSFLAGYGLALCLGLLVSLTWVLPRLRRMLSMPSAAGSTDSAFAPTAPAPAPWASH